MTTGHNHDNSCQHQAKATKPLIAFGTEDYTKHARRIIMEQDSSVDSGRELLKACWQVVMAVACGHGWPNHFVSLTADRRRFRLIEYQVGNPQVPSRQPTGDRIALIQFQSEKIFVGHARRWQPSTANAAAAGNAHT